jgi:DnaJ-class molecular chaperone
MLGTRKLINLAQGFRKKTFWLTIPPGVTEGSSLRLKGLGQQRPDGVSGDLYLKVFIRD